MDKSFWTYQLSFSVIIEYYRSKNYSTCWLCNNKRTRIAKGRASRKKWIRVWNGNINPGF